MAVRACADQGSARTRSDPGEGLRSSEKSSVQCQRTSSVGNADGADGLPYIQPGPWKSKLTEKDVVGVWLGFGVGAPKQFFIIKKVGDRLRGMVCGTCDNPYTMAALDDFRIEGDTLRFNILHEDWGDGEIPTFDEARDRARRLERDAVHDGRRSPAAPPPPPRRAGSRDSRCRDRFRSRRPPATSGRVATEEHVVAALMPRPLPEPGCSRE